MDATELKFWHGTSATAAIGILTEGACDFPSQLGEWNLAKKIWPPILAKAVNEWETATLFQQAGCRGFIAAPLALKGLHADAQQASQYSYGQFYVTTSRDKAARYARRNRTGSEILSVIEDGLQVIDQFDRVLGDELRASYPELTKFLSMPAHAIVLELRGICADRLTNDRGKTIDDLEEFEFVASAECTSEPAFRIAGVTPADVVAVYDLAKAQAAADEPISLECWERIQSSPTRWLPEQQRAANVTLGPSSAGWD